MVGEPSRRGLLVPLLTDVHDTEVATVSLLSLAGRRRLADVWVLVGFLVATLGDSPWRHAELSSCHASLGWESRGASWVGWRSAHPTFNAAER